LLLTQGPRRGTRQGKREQCVFAMNGLELPYKQVQITERNATKKRSAPFGARSAFKLWDNAL
ncbi:uncharacterized protein SCHCODRAFT_02638842, partial [Schizophyllum commune H4-8]|uniref:uncharacterized protein n=1 Tax=Schizophyllum commune (strain H4-8 / FGSC 9210) TaxID=578458 RepID=UPI00215FF397